MIENRAILLRIKKINDQPFIEVVLFDKDNLAPAFDKVVDMSTFSRTENLTLFKTIENYLYGTTT